MAEYTKKIGIAVTIAVVASLGLGGFAYYSSSSVSLSSQTSGTSPCSTASSTVIPQFAHLSTNPPKPAILVLVLQPGSTATLCVRYLSWESSPKLGFADVESVVLVETCSKGSDNATHCYGTPASDVVVAASPKKTIHNSTDITVAFTINADGNSTGHYLFAIPYSCPAVAMAVGYQPAQLRFSDFPGAGPIPCPAPVVQTEIVGVLGASTTYLGY